jgi:chitinase
MAKSPIVLGYYADWAENLSPEAIDYRLLTHLSHSFATLNEKGMLKLPDASRTKTLTTLAKRAKVKTILAFGGAESGKAFAAATATDAAVTTFASQIAQILGDLGYDGADVDWEVPSNSEEKGRMEALVKTLRQKAPKAILTAATPASDWSGKWYATEKLAPYLDFINVMTYDFHGPWGNHAGHNAPLTPTSQDREDGQFSVTSAMDYWLKSKKWPANQLCLGIPSYGRGFAAKLGAPTKGEYSRSYVSYQEVLMLTRDSEWIARRDAEAQVPYLEKKDGKEFVSYEDPESARRKGAFARKLGLSGIFFWEVAQDFDGRTHPIVRAAREGWG